MLLKTILNKCCKFKSFVAVGAGFDENGGAIILSVKCRVNARPMCSRCGKTAPGYDTPKGCRWFDFIPFWGFQVYLEYAMSRVKCAKCGVRVEKVPWADGNRHLTFQYVKYLADWAKVISWKEVAKRFHTSWETVRKSVESVVEYGLKHRRVDNVEAIGIDEVQYHKGHKYLTSVQKKQCTRKSNR